MLIKSKKKGVEHKSVKKRKGKQASRRKRNQNNRRWGDSGEKGKHKQRQF